MEDLSIKVQVANRMYPLTVKADQEEVMRRAARLITDKMKVYEANYSVKDQQDLLAMCALEFAARALEAENHKNSLDPQIVEQLEEMEKFLSQYLNRY